MSNHSANTMNLHASLVSKNLLMSRKPGFRNNLSLKSWTLLLLILTTSSLAAEKPVKTGFNLGGLPAVSYNTDEGFQYGVILNLFNYGDGSRFPAYNYSAYLEASRFTKGSSLLRLYFDSDQLIKGVRSFIDASYVQEDLLDFYGFNGYQSLFSTDTTALNRTFYRMSQKQVRFMADFKGQLLAEHLNWLLSYNFFYYNPGDVNFDKLNKGVAETDPDYLVGTSLYGKYVEWGLISAEEADGGAVQSLKAGLLYDTRNALVNPSRGICAEAVIEVAPGFLNELPYTRYSLVHRHYLALIKNKLNLAMRLGAQGKIGNRDIPFYRRTQLISPFATRSNVTGLGGANSLRGIMRNRLVGDGIAYGNFELRWRTINFTFFKQHCYLGFNGFFDTGIVTDAVDIDYTNISDADREAYFADITNQSLHSAVGGGLKLAMNENFVISVDLGKALDTRDADGMGMYININYLY